LNRRVTGPLDPRQVEVLQLAAEGLSAPRIAERLVPPGCDDPLAGYIPPNGKGTGLWAAPQLTRSVEFGRSQHGFTTRLSV
jgi:hypothetical protein